MSLHPWWTNFGVEIASPAELVPEPAKALAAFLQRNTVTGAVLVAMRQDPELGAAIHLEIEVERPQDLAHPIRAVEPITIIFPYSGGQPRVFALREDFPYTAHRNWGAADTPRSLCIDDRPWAEAKLTTTSADLVRRTQHWLAKAARGELHDPALPPEPLFFGSGLAMVIPPDSLSGAVNTVELVGIMRPDNNRLILTYHANRVQPAFANLLPAFMVLGFRAEPQTVDRMRDAPRTLAELADELRACGVDLMQELEARLKGWAGVDGVNVRHLACRLAVVVSFPVIASDGKTNDDLFAFFSVDSVGDVGVALGILTKNLPPKPGYVRQIPAGASTGGASSHVEPAQVHLAFTRELAATVAGAENSDKRAVVMVGAGSIGSHIAVDLAREGKFSWSVVDDDYILPHNIARHALYPNDVGASKATALARQLSELFDEPCQALVCNVLYPSDKAQELAHELNKADVIIDTSASVAVSRHLSDLADVRARRLSAFFNPTGTAVVLLAEGADRAISLRDLEAQYHRAMQGDSRLAGHLDSTHQGVRYSGSCRALTNKISATKAALLSALAARGFGDALNSDDASARIWQLQDDGSVDLFDIPVAPVHQVQFGDWSVTYDDRLLEMLSRMRRDRLPNETGGVLLGVVDNSRKSIHVVLAFPQPEDSKGTPGEFVRGVVALREIVDAAVTRSMHQLRYIGEWHSHPRRASTTPSDVDLAQIAWLGQEMEVEGLPGLMAIAGDNGAFTFVTSRPIEQTNISLVEAKKADRP